MASLVRDPILKEWTLKGASPGQRQALLAAGWAWDPVGRNWYADGSAQRKAQAERILGMPVALTKPTAAKAPAKPAPVAPKTKPSAAQVRPAAPARPASSRPVPSPAQPAAVCAAVYLPVDSILADPRRFQGRTKEVSPESVARIVADFDPRRLDPIVVWHDPASGRYYVLSGHSRLEAMRQLGQRTIPARIFSGSEAEAVTYSKGYANRLATAETLAEDVATYRAYRDGRLAQGLKPATRAELKKLFPRADQLEELSYLDPAGKWMQLLAQSKDQQDQFPYLVARARSVGALRRLYGDRLSRRHEDELFDFYLLTENQNVSREELNRRVALRVDGLWWKPEEALGLMRSESELELRADTSASARRRKEIATELMRLAKARDTAQTQEAKRALNFEIRALQVEDERLRQGLNDLIRTQAGLFGFSAAERRALAQRVAALESAYELEGRAAYGRRWESLRHVGSLTEALMRLRARLQNARTALWAAEDAPSDAPIKTPGEQLRLTPGGRTGAQSALFGPAGRKRQVGQLPRGVAYTLVDSYVLDEGDLMPCDNCGAMLRNVCAIRAADGGGLYRVGTDCAESLTGEIADQAVAAEHQFKTAARVARQIKAKQKAGVEVTISPVNEYGVLWWYYDGRMQGKADADWWNRMVAPHLGQGNKSQGALTHVPSPAAPTPSLTERRGYADRGTQMDMFSPGTQAKLFGARMRRKG